MKTAKCFLLTSLIVSFAAPVFARLEIHVSDNKEPQPLLIGKPNPVLAGIDRLCVIITPSGYEPNKAALVWKDLKTKIENQLTQSGIQTIPCSESNAPSDSPELRIEVNIFKPENSALYVFHIQTSLARLVRLGENPHLSVKADVWKISSEIQTSANEDLPAAVSALAAKQVDAFIHLWLAADPKEKSAGNINNAPAVIGPPQLTEPNGKSAIPQYKYIASKKGKVFHKPDCTWASRIKPENLIGYNNLQDALDAGKKPCKQCKP
jgi:hypothetical protein